jgi:8-oxo-dGTP pyrophosphatase MutT (NUDIX family)
MPALGEAPSPLIRVVAAVIHRDGKYLICQRPAHKRHGLLWEFPGGKCEPEESDVDALRRELKEELDVQLESAGGVLFSSHDDGSPFLVVFLTATIAGDIRCSEHAAFAWHTPSQLASMALAPSDSRFVAHVLLPTHVS